jgi:hypothetical protein
MARGEKKLTGSQKAVGYIRTEPEDSGPSAATQRAELEVYCEDKGYSLDVIWEDPNVSLETPFDQRIGLAHALNDLARRNANVLVVADKSRLTDDEVKGVIIETLAKRRSGARIETADGVAVDWGKQASDTRSIVAQFIECSERLDFAMQAQDDPTDMEAIQMAKNMREKRLNKDTGQMERMSFEQISVELEKRGLVSRHGTRYSPQQVASMCDKFTQQELERMGAEERARAEARKELQERGVLAYAK